MFKNILPSQSIAEKKSYYPFIDGLRGIAILMVLLLNTSSYVGNDYGGSFNFKILEDFVNAGARGVQLFFIISAFTLFSSSHDRYHTDAYPKIDFYIRRAFRILPYWSLMVIFAAFMSGAIYDTNRIITNISFAFGFIRFRSGVELVPGAWSLFVEEVFYLMLPVIFFFIKDIYKAFKFFLITLLIACAWYKFASLLGVPNGRDFIFLFPLSHWYAFSLGIILYFLIANQKFIHLVLTSSVNLLILDSVAFISILVVLRQIWIIATCSLVLVFIASVPEKSIFGRITRNKILMRFGVYCYSIYLFHIFLLKLIDPLKKLLFYKFGIADLAVELKLLVWFPIVALVSFCLAFFTFNLIEKPCITLGKKLIPRINVALDSLFKRGIIFKLKRYK